MGTEVSSMADVFLLLFCCVVAGRHLRQTLLQPGGSIDPLELLTAAFGGQEATSQVLVQQQHSGWSPNPASLLHSSSASARVLATA